MRLAAMGASRTLFRQKFEDPAWGWWLRTFPAAGVDTENAVRIENAGFRSVLQIIIVSKMSPFFIALLALVASTLRTRAQQDIRTQP
jgi:hypothetical protein